MKSQIKTVVSLTVICAVVAVLLAVTNYITAPIIKKNEAAQVSGALSVVLPSGEGFEAVDISKYELPETITEVYSEKNGGYVFKMLTSGYGSDFVLMCGIDANGAVAGATCISSNETLGAEKEYGKTLVGATGETIDGVATVSGATRTTDAYKNAVRDALNAKIILGGGSVDLRDEAQILADNLNAALPAGEGKFTPVFITENLEGVQEVYKAENGAGYVLKSGENFIAATADGTVVSEVADDVKTLMSDNAKKLISSKLTQIDISGYSDMPTQIEEAYKTDSGNYVFHLKAAGFGINGDAWYNPSGEYIKIKVSATKDGKIIACETVSQKETDGIGSACADKKFYSQFNGKEQTNYKEIDAISGATVTTNGYKTAISKVFDAINILKGVS